MTTPPRPTGFINNPGGRETVRFSTILPALATFAVVGRLVLRTVQRVGWSTDDYLIVFALFCIWALASINIYVWHYGLGLHITEVPVEYIVKDLQALYAYNLIYILDIGAVKLSILFFYRRVFAINRRTRITLYCIMAFIVAWVIAYFFAMMAQCTPVEYFWTRGKGAVGSCDNTYALYISENIINVITDFAIYLFPMPIVWALQMPRSQKFGLLLIFMAGGLVCAISIVRTTTIKELVDPDFTWSDSNPGDWAILEVCIACITACLPTTRALVVRWVSPFKSWTSSKRHKYASHGSGSDDPSQSHHKTANESSTAFVSDVQTGSREKDLESGIPMGSLQAQRQMPWPEDRAHH